MYHRSASLIAVSVVLGVLATIAVALRYTARYIKGLRIWVDDHLVLVALVLSWGVCICNVVGACVARFGNHEIYETSGPNKGRPLAELMILYGKICFASRLLHSTAMQLLKIALLVFYRRLFGQDKRFVAVFWAMITYVSLWWLVCFWLNVFTCYPIPWAWSPSKEMATHCIHNYHAFFSYQSLTNVISDVLVAVVPLPFLYAVPMNSMKKLAVGSMLLTASIVVVAGIGRTYAFFTVSKSTDYTYENYEYLIWSSVEPCVGVIGCCLPTLRPLFTRNTDFTLSRFSRYDHDRSRSRHTPRRMSSMEATLTDGSQVEKGAALRYQGTSLQETASIGVEHEMDALPSAIALYNPTPRLDDPGPSSPLRQHPVGRIASPKRASFNAIGTAY